jgi:hypothetical protein
MGDWFSEEYSGQAAPVSALGQREENERMDRARWANDAEMVRAALAPWSAGDFVDPDGYLYRFASNAGEAPEFGGSCWRVTLLRAAHPEQGVRVEVLGRYDWDRSAFITMDASEVLKEMGEGWQEVARREIVIGPIEVKTSTDIGHALYSPSGEQVGLFFRGKGGRVFFEGGEGIGRRWDIPPHRVKTPTP